MSGVDPLRQFPNSRMAQAVRLGQSRFVSTDQPSQELGEVNNASAAGTVTLTPPSGGDNGNAVYVVLTAVGGPLYITFDNSVPAAGNYAVTLAAGASLPLYGAAMAQAKFTGTNYSALFMA